MTEFTGQGGPRADLRYDALPILAPFTGDQLKVVLTNALHDPARDPIAEADAYRDTPPEDIADELQLAKGEIAWLREAVRRYSAAPRMYRLLKELREVLEMVPAIQATNIDLTVIDRVLAASGMEARQRQDAKRLDPKDDSPTAEGWDAQTGGPNG